MPFKNQQRIESKDQLPKIFVADKVKIIVCHLNVPQRSLDEWREKLFAEYNRKPPA